MVESANMRGMADGIRMGIGESDVFLDFQNRLSSVAKVDRSVLIIGERGSGKELPVFSDEVTEELMNYSWPGNVRELKNVVERAVYRSEGSLIEHVDFNPFKNPFAKPEEKQEEETGEKKTTPVNGGLEAYPLKDFALAQEQLDLIFLSRALGEAGGSQKLAANLLNLTYDQFRGLYRKYKSLLTL